MRRDTLENWLRSNGINPTGQRLAVAGLFHGRCVHLSAEDIFELVKASGQKVSRATVYNTLALLVDKGLVRQVVADPTRIFYDSNTTAHHHFFDVQSGELTDIASSELAVSGVPSLPKSTTLEGIDVVVRVRPKS